MKHDESGYGSGAIIISFLLGGLVGAGAALLLAPKSGKETRERLADMADEAREKTGEYVDGLKDRVTSTISKGKDFFQDKKSIITTAVEAGREAYEKEKEKLSKGH